MQLVPRAFQEKCQVQLGIGLSREYLGWTGRRKTVAGSDLRLLYAGRLLEWKGVDLALRALRELRERGDGVCSPLWATGRRGAGCKG